MATKLQKTPAARLSYPSLFKPKEDPEKTADKWCYEATLIFTAADDLSQIEADIDAAAEKAWGLKKSAMLAKVKYFPIKLNQNCTDNEGTRRGGYEEDGGRYIKFKNTRKPKIVGREIDPVTKELVRLKEGEIWPGCYVKVSYTIYCGVHETGGPYVKMDLQNLQLWAEGEPLAGVISNPDDDFADDPAIAAALA